MRQLLFFLFLLAFVPVAYGQSQAFAEYNPATGDVVLRNVRGTVHLSFGVLWPYFMSEDVSYDPPIFFRLLRNHHLRRMSDEPQLGSRWV